MTTPKLTRALVTERSHSPHRERSPSRRYARFGSAGCCRLAVQNGFSVASVSQRECAGVPAETGGPGFSELG